MQLIRAATPDVPNQTPMPQPSKQLLNACPIPPVHVIVKLSAGCQIAILSSFFFVPALVSSAIKANSVLRQQWPRGMYSKVSLATRLDAGEGVLHRGRAQWGRRTCMYCTLHAGGGACHDHRGSTPRKTAKLRLHQNQRATNHQELTIRTYRGPLMQNQKTHRGGK